MHVTEERVYRRNVIESYFKRKKCLKEGELYKEIKYIYIYISIYIYIYIYREREREI